MASRSSVRLGIDTLEDRTVPSINGLTESLRVIDPTNPDVVGITRSTQQNLTDALHTDTSVDPSWDFLSRKNGVDTDLVFQKGFNGNTNLVASGREGATNYLHVQPLVWMDQVNSTTVRVRFQNMQPNWCIIVAGGAGTIGGGWTTNMNDQFTFTLPAGSSLNAAGVKIVLQNGTQIPTGLQVNYRSGTVQAGGRFGQGDTIGSLAWDQPTPPREPDFLVAKNIDSSDATNYGTTWHAGETLVRPGTGEDAVIRWTSPLKGTVTVDALLRDAQPNWGDGVTATIERKNAQGTTVMATGLVNDAGSFHFVDGTPVITVDVGDTISLVVSAKGTNNDPTNTTGDATVVQMKVTNTETEKNFEHVTVVPRVNFELSADQRTITVRYNNIDPNDDIRLAVSVPGYTAANGIKLWDASGTTSINTSPYNKNTAYTLSLMRGPNQILSENFAAFALPIGNSATDWTVSGLTTDTIRFPEFAHDALLPQDRAISMDEIQGKLSLQQYNTDQRAIPAPRDWTEGKTFNWITVAQQYGVIVNQPITGTGGTYLVAKGASTGLFSRLKAVSERSAQITKLWYITADGLKPLPKECYTIFGSDFIIKPNGPSTLVYEVKVDGTLQAGEAATGTTMESVLPIVGQKVVGYIEKIDAQGGAYQGFGPMITEVSASANAVLNPGGTVHVITQLESVGTQSGALTVRVYCGYAGNTTDPLQRTFQTTMNPNQKQSLVFNVTSPMSTDPNARAIITFEVQYANGTKEILAQKITHGSVEDPLDAAARIAALKQQLAIQKTLPMYASDGVTIIGMGGILFAGNQQTQFIPETQRLSQINPHIVSTGELYAMAADNILIPSRSESSSLSIDPNIGRTTAENFSLLAAGEHRFTFTLPWDAMVSAWVDTGGKSLVLGSGNPYNLDFALQISGDSLPQRYISDRGIGSGESVSLKLLAGQTYTVTVHDQTSYATSVPLGTRINNLNLGLDIRKFDNRDITGRISIAERAVTMPVEMRVAEFLTNGQRKDSQNVLHSLDVSVPVWVVIHGMNDKDSDVGINNLARALTNYSGIQVVTVNWQDAAKAPLDDATDAPWTAPVGKWIADQLIGMGFDPAKINIVGHSHGTYVAYALAQEVIAQKGQQINALVALDPAVNLPAISGFDTTGINFKAVSRNSVALEGSLFGSNTLASTADVTFQINCLNTQDPIIQHSLPVSAFTNILDHERLHPGTFAPQLSLANIMTPVEQNAAEASLKKDMYNGTYEGIIDVNATNPSSGVWEAALSRVRFIDAQILQELIEIFDQNH